MVAPATCHDTSQYMDMSTSIEEEEEIYLAQHNHNEHDNIQD